MEGKWYTVNMWNKLSDSRALESSCIFSDSGKKCSELFTRFEFFLKLSLKLHPILQTFLKIYEFIAIHLTFLKNDRETTLDFWKQKSASRSQFMIQI
jgi:hypothetical protein